MWDSFASYWDECVGIFGRSDQLWAWLNPIKPSTASHFEKHYGRE
jgi:hypothetical protein